MHSSVSDAEISLLVDLLAELPIVSRIEEVAISMNRQVDHVYAVVNAAERAGLVQRWDACEDGPSVTLSPLSVSERGLLPLKFRWTTPDRYDQRNERAAKGREVVVSNLVPGATNEYLDRFASDEPEPIDALIAAEEESDRYDYVQPEGRLSAIEQAEDEERARFVPTYTNLIGGSMAWYVDPLQVATVRATPERDVRWGQMRERGRVEESAVLTEACPGCGGVKRAGVFCLRCAS